MIQLVKALMQDNNRAAFDRWFRQAEFDLKTAKKNAENKDFEWACFAAQQSAEKALKAFLLLKGKRGLMTHSIFALLKETIELDKSFTECMDCKALDHYYITTRYPEGLPDGIPHEYFNEGDSQLCIAYAGRILSAIRTRTQK